MQKYIITNIIVIIIIIIILNIASADEKKSTNKDIYIIENKHEIPSQETLNKLFGNNFNIKSQIDKTWTKEELYALDKSLEAMNMNRNDMNFRKDYVKAKLAFPIILDMLKHPLHIAPYMDAFINLISELKNESFYTLHEFLASCMIHPGIDNDKIPHKDSIKNQIEMIKLDDDVKKTLDTLGNDPVLTYLFKLFSKADMHIKKAFEKLTDFEKKILIHSLPLMITEHNVFLIKISDNEKKKIDEFIKKQTNDYLNKLASKVNLTEMAIAYISLIQLENNMIDFNKINFPKDKPKIIDTPWGKMVLGTINDDTYKGDYSIFIEPNGNDTYLNCRLGATDGYNTHIGFFIDLAGDDIYLCQDKNINLGASVMGISIFYDLGDGNDEYKSGHFSQGATTCGFAFLYDDGGSNDFTGKSYVQGAAAYGIASLIANSNEIGETLNYKKDPNDEEVNENKIINNNFKAWVLAQGFSRQYGIGICHGSKGNDIYFAGGIYLHTPLFNDRYQSFSQGFSIGDRYNNYAGGIAFLIDDGGNDYYLGDIYNQGVGYWYSGGFLYDKAGNDHYEMTQYGQGSGIHLAVGGLIDNSGHDSYIINAGLGQGGSHDYAASVMIDRRGNDKYLGATSCNGCGLTNAVGLFFDRSGNDMYGGNPDGYAIGSGRWNRNTGSIGVFVDAKGKDYYPATDKNNILCTKTFFGASYDFDNEKLISKQINNSTPNISKIKIPAICSYKGQLNDEIFEILWNISIRWEVGDNRIIVPKARDRLVEFDKNILPYIDKKLDSTNGLVYRAFIYIFPKLYNKCPDDVIKLLQENIESECPNRKLNAIRLSSSMKLTSMEKYILNILDTNDEKLIKTAISALGELKSTKSADKLLIFLDSEKPESIIQETAKSLIKMKYYNIYPKLRILLDHKYMTVRESIIRLLKENIKAFRDKIFNDIILYKVNKRSYISLLRVVAKMDEYPVNKRFVKIILEHSQNKDWVIRAHSILILKSMLSYDSKEWKDLNKGIENHLNHLKCTESDPYVKYILD